MLYEIFDFAAHLIWRLTPELSRPAKRVRLGRTVMRAKVNPKPAARNGPGRVGSTDKASEGTEQVEASKGRGNSAAHPKVMKPSLCRAARTYCVRSRVKRSRETSANPTRQRPINAEVCDAAGIAALPKPTTPKHLPTHNTRVKPTREAGSAWTTCYARQGKPEAAGLQRERENGEHGRTVRKLGAGRGQQRPKPTAPPIRRS